MALWIDENGNLHDDMDGEALSLPTWPKGMTKLTDAQVADLQLKAARQAQISQVTLDCQAEIIGGFTSKALGALYTYPSTLTDQQNLSANVVSSLVHNLPADWTTKQLCADSSGTWAYRDHTAAQIQQVGEDGKAAIMALLQKKNDLVAKIEAAASLADVQSVKWS